MEDNVMLPDSKQKMTAWGSFILIIRIVFVLFSLQFLKDAFYKWDGYSYYIKFWDFLPDLSLVFILWTLTGIIAAFLLWCFTYAVSRLIPIRLLYTRLEYCIFFSVFFLLPFIFKKIFYSDFSISSFLGVSRIVIVFFALLIIAFLLWFIRKDIKNFPGKVLSAFNSRISPVVWIFFLLFVISIPFPFFKYEVAGDEYKQETHIDALQTDEKRPNIILIVMDALSSIDMQLYGYKYPTTPYLSNWAEKAVVFNRYYATSNWTSPTVMSMMTGQRPWTHKVWYQAKFSPVRNYKENMPRILRDYGYDVYAFVQNPYAHPETLGIEDSFILKDKDYTFTKPDQRWVKKLSSSFLVGWPIVQEWVFKNNDIAKLILENFHPDYFETLTPPGLVYGRFLDVISERKKSESTRPFFALLHLFPPHDPYLPPKPFMGYFGDSDKYISGDGQYSNFNFYSEYEDDKQGEVDILRKRYDEYILYSDREFEKFMSRLNDIIDLSNTVFIFTSDHGECFTNGYLTHTGLHLYEPLVRVPLVIKFPNQDKGKVIDSAVEQIGLAPTILNIAGISAPQWMEGKSFMPLIQGDLKEQVPVFSMQLEKNRVFDKITKGTFSVWDGDYKLIYYLEDDKSLLFDLKNDPGETTDIATEKVEVAERLLKLITDNIAIKNQ